MFSLSQPFPRNTWLLIAIGIFLIGAIVCAYRIYQTQTAIFWNYRTGAWLVVEAQAEFQNTLVASKNFEIDPSQSAYEELLVRFDVFWSRVPLILESDEGVDVRRIDAIMPNTQRILSELPLLDEDLTRIEVGDAGSARPFERRLAALSPTLEEMTRVVLVQDDLRYRSGSLLKEMWWTIAAFLLAIGAGIVLIIGNIINTNRVRNLMAQREAIERAQAAQLAAIESSGEGIAMFDARGRLGYANAAFHALIGDGDARILNLSSWRRLLAPGGARTLLRGLRETGRTPWKGELAGRTLAGAERDWEAHVTRRDEGGFIAVVRDLTDRKAAERERNQLQQQLHRVEKMDAVGRLAGGVAHDFNNILAAILGFGSLLELDLDDRPEQRTMAQQILTAAERGRELVQSIMTFSRTEKSERSVIEVGAIGREAAAMAATAMAGPAVFETEIAQGSLPIVGNATQINQAILNLCINARDALEGNRGTVRLSVDRVPVADVCTAVPASHSSQPAVVRIEPVSATRTRAWIGGADRPCEMYVRIRVSDNGSGISRGIMEKMFDPFFTTKDVGRGTGLGLASVLGIAKAHGGAIAVDSTVGEGSTFALLLPLHAAAEVNGAFAPAPMASGKQPATALSDMHVLLVDDDPGAGSALSAILQKIGCDVSYVGSGGEALAVVADEPDWFDIIITDLAMPEMSGLDLAGRLRAIRFTRPIVLASARLQDAPFEDRARVGIECTIAKPFTLSEVAAVIWSVAGARATGKVEAPARADAVASVVL